MADTHALTRSASAPDELVPDSVIPPGSLPRLRYRELPEAMPMLRMLGPSIILAGLALGSGEYVIWPYITYVSGFGFFWACLLAVATQYFVNMEITRWGLATGESAITGFCRLSRWWAPVFLALNVIPWVIPAWAVGAAEIAAWLATGSLDIEPYVKPLAIGGLFLCGAVLTTGPVVYETVERFQAILVIGILVVLCVLAATIVRGDAVERLLEGSASIGSIPRDPRLPADLLLGALAFAGAGGTLNLGQSNYVKEKGYGMGRYVGRITSPITGKEEAAVEIGFHFPHTRENLARWRTWWFRAGLEHFVSFYLTCVVCLVLLTLIAYSLFYDETGALRTSVERGPGSLAFVWDQAIELHRRFGPWGYTGFLLVGVAVLLTTEFGVLDGTSRISMDIVKVNWLRESAWWTESRLYYLFLWATILVATGIILMVPSDVTKSMKLFQLTAAMNGGVMFLYSMTVAYLNFFRLPPPVRISWWRLAIMFWSVLFFGAFSVWAVVDRLRAWEVL